MITNAITNQLKETRKQAHPRCAVCSPDNEQGLQLDFYISGQDEISADFIYENGFEGYPGMLHGGVIAAILDGAMTNCLFAKNHTAFTADFRIRFRHPVMTGKTAHVRAWITRVTPPIFEVKAKIVQEYLVKTTATAKFMEQRRLDMDQNSVPAHTNSG